MLSKVAERVYWLARYIERVENTARLARVHSQLMFDLPKSVKLSWYALVQITSNEDYFERHYDARTEKNCMLMLLADRNNPASLISSLWWARENMRTTRDILPREAWIQINELYLLVKESQGDFEVRGKRNALLDKIIRACQAWSGMLSGTMSENETYRFIKLGMSIERADMTTRLLDVGGLFIAQESFAEEDSHFDAILWAHLLKSAGVYFMYRQQVQTEICGERVVDFLMKDPQLARSVAFCVQNMRRLVEYLPNAAPLAKELDDLQEAIKSDHLYSLGSSELHDYLDWIQARLSSLHGQFYAVWFNPMAVA
jgi:uncharacterized alpha-E superfamily protein